MAIRRAGWFVIAALAIVFLLTLLSPHALPAGTRFSGATAFGDWLNKGHDEADVFNDIKWQFQFDLDLKNPTFDSKKLRRYTPHNYQGPGHETYATFLSTRNGSMQDPYFMAAQQLAYRILWNDKSKSKKHPLTVFVAPFIDDEKRELLAAAGALVREIDLVAWHPAAATFGRWRDLFSKLIMWAQTDFTRITFLDLDAFPMVNIDEIFDIAPHQECKKELLPKQDKKKADEICGYTFTGTEVGEQEINVGVMVFEPNTAMYERLMRESVHTERFDNSMAEQAFLSYAFKQDGAFPGTFIDRTWNGFFPQEPERKTLNIIHEKLWAENEELTWAQSEFNGTWKDMLKLYDSKKFVQMREKDGLRLY